MKLNNLTTGLIYPALLFVMFIALFVVPAFAGEWNDKPVICADQAETFSAIASGPCCDIALYRTKSLPCSPPRSELTGKPVTLPFK